jgi:DNA invertase Pin-like site-specific DNA recombinase
LPQPNIYGYARVSTEDQELSLQITALTEAAVARKDIVQEKAKDLDARGVRIVITTLGVDLKTPAGRLVYGVLAQIAEFERERIKERVTAGIAAARKRGVAFGRRHTLRPNQRAEAVRMHLGEGKSIGAIAALFGCGRTVMHRAMKGA